MLDYGKLIDEEKERENSALAAAARSKAREIELVAFFREVEIELGREMARANAELKKRAAPIIFGPFRPVRDQEKIELALGLRNPCCRIILQHTSSLLDVSAIQVELLDEAGVQVARTRFVIEGERPLKAYRTMVEDFPDRSAELSPSEIAQEIVSGLIRGRLG